MLPAREWLFTDCAEDNSLLKELFAGEVRVKDDIVVATTSSPVKSKLYKQIEVMTLSVQPLFKKLETQTWAEVKESAFTNPYNKMHGLQGQAEAVGDEDSINLSQKWCAGLQAAKLFLGRHRDFNKAKGKTRNSRACTWPSRASLTSWSQRRE